MLNLESAELAGGRTFVATLVSNEIEEPFRDCAQKGIVYPRFPFRNQLHAAIRQVAHESSYLIRAGNRAGRVAKANALHAARIINRRALWPAGWHKRTRSARVSHVRRGSPDPC